MNLLQKGSVLTLEGWFYVVIRVAFLPTIKQFKIQCICDNANNRYSFSIDELISQPNFILMSAKTAVHYSEWGAPAEMSNEQLSFLKNLEREIPLNVIAEALSGIHDHRFDD